MRYCAPVGQGVSCHDVATGLPGTATPAPATYTGGEGRTSAGGGVPLNTAVLRELGMRLAAPGTLTRFMVSFGRTGRGAAEPQVRRPCGVTVR